MTTTIHYQAEGTGRKELAKKVSEIIGAKSRYLGIPSYAYQIDYFTVTREGNLEFDSHTDSKEIEHLLESLAEAGFIAKASNEPQEEETAPQGADSPPQAASICIDYPLDGLTETAKANLELLIKSKETLMKKAFTAESLDFTVEADRIRFPWFTNDETFEGCALAYGNFISKLCGLAKQLKRVNGKAKEVPNEKYAFRCFLLRLGFVGKEYKKTRKILLKNFEGSSAFRNGGSDHAISE